MREDFSEKIILLFVLMALTSPLIIILCVQVEELFTVADVLSFAISLKQDLLFT